MFFFYSSFTCRSLCFALPRNRYLKSQSVLLGTSQRSAHLDVFFQKRLVIGRMNRNDVRCNIGRFYCAKCIYAHISSIDRRTVQCDVKLKRWTVFIEHSRYQCEPYWRQDILALISLMAIYKIYCSGASFSPVFALAINANTMPMSGYVRAGVMDTLIDNYHWAEMPNNRHFNWGSN